MTRSRDRTLTLVVAAAVGALALVVLAVTLTRAEPSGDEATAAQAFRGTPAPARLSLPSFTLRDHDGAAVSSEALRGNVIVLTFLATRCNEACPIIAGEITATARLLTASERREVTFIAITSDPRYDTPSAIRSFLRAHGALGTLRYLSGPVPTLRNLWRRFQVLSSLESGNADTHSAPVRIYNRDLTWIATQHVGADLTPANLAHDIRIALRGAEAT